MIEGHDWILGNQKGNIEKNVNYRGNNEVYPKKSST
jgi:hypothetical protein